MMLESRRLSLLFLFFFFNDTATTEIYTLSLHDALPIWLAVFAEDGTEENVIELRVFRPASLLRGGENFLKMLDLSGIGDVHDAISVLLIDAIANGGQVGGVVAETPVGLSDDQRRLERRNKNAQSTVAELCDTELFQVVSHPWKFVVVKTFTADVVFGEQNVEAAIDLLKVSGGFFDEFFPEGNRAGITSLQLHDAPTGTIGEIGVFVELAFGLPVKGVEIADVELGLFSSLLVEHVFDEHAELRAPVADVVLTDDRVAALLKDADDGVADDGRAQVPDVHFLRDVGAGVIDDDFLRMIDRGSGTTV